MTKLEIANTALMRLGSGVLQSLDENSNDALYINAMFDSTLEEVLREAYWSCCTKRVKLPQTGETPVFGYGYEYHLPADHLLTIDCFNTSGVYSEDVYWKVEGRKVLTDEPELFMSYVFNPTDVQVIDSLCVQALAVKLAIKIGYAKTAEAALINMLTQEYDRILLQKAKSIDSMEGYNQGKFTEPSWIQSRYTGIIG